MGIIFHQSNFLLTVPSGDNSYQLTAGSCTGVGVEWTDAQLDEALGGPVAEILFDDVGTADIAAILAPLANTPFAQESVRRILSIPEQLEDWRVGEAIAETYLLTHRACYIPWPDGRDERKSGSSLPGADLVGFGKDTKGDCFAFGEVKTSRQNQYPPGVVFGRGGLKQQLEDLRDQKSITDNLMKYLGHRAKTAPWRPSYQAASRRYLINSSDIHIYGVLIRDVEPNEDDLRTRVQGLSKDCPQETSIELLAIYLPSSSIKGIGDRAIAKRTGGAR